MCGLTGIAGRGIYTVDLDFFKDLLYLSAFRGRDSTGVAAIKTKNNTFTIRKHEIEPAEFVNTYGGQKGFLSNPDNDIYMGHARWATKGAVNSDNAHPFETEKYIGAHNGTLTDYRFVDKSGKMTDSELMFREMDKKGIVETMSSLNPSSAWAVSIYDKHTRKLWLGRNAHRSLFVSFLVGGDVMAWSSEQEMIEFASNRDRGPKVETFRLLPNYLYEIDVREIKSKSRTPWIAHKLERKEDPLMKPDWRSSSALAHPGIDTHEWDGVLSGDWENDYRWDKVSQRYVVRDKTKVSPMSELVTELETSVEESRQNELDYRQSLLI